jgi:hypothetical protein
VPPTSLIDSLDCSFFVRLLTPNNSFHILRFSAHSRLRRVDPHQPRDSPGCAADANLPVAAFLHPPLVFGVIVTSKTCCTLRRATSMRLLPAVA